jgi:hypothetical protein
MVCNAGDVAAGTSKAINQAIVDRIGPSAHHNDGNRLGRIFRRPDYVGPSCCHDGIDLKTHQLGRKLREPVKLSLGMSVLDRDVPSFDVANLAQRQPNSLETSRLTSWLLR